MKKLWLLFVLLLVATQCYALTWTKNWSSTDDGKVLSGSDIQSFQNDVSSQGVNQSGDNTFTGNITFSGASTLSGSNTFSGTTNIAPHVHMMTRPAGAYKTIKVGSFTRVLNLPSSSQSITGVGFKPTKLIFLSTTFGDDTASWGIGSSTAGQSGGMVIGPDHWGPDVYVNTVQPIYLLTGPIPSYDYVHQPITSFDDDGFTIYWENVADPGGTGIIIYIAFAK